MNVGECLCVYMRCAYYVYNICVACVVRCACCTSCVVRFCASLCMCLALRVDSTKFEQGLRHAKIKAHDADPHALKLANTYLWNHDV